MDSHETQMPRPATSQREKGAQTRGPASRGAWWPSTTTTILLALALLNLGYFAYAWFEQHHGPQARSPVGQVILGRTTGVADAETTSGGWRVNAVEARVVPLEDARPQGVAIGPATGGVAFDADRYDTAAAGAAGHATARGAEAQ